MAPINTAYGGGNCLQISKTTSTAVLGYLCLQSRVIFARFGLVHLEHRQNAGLKHHSRFWSPYLCARVLTWPIQPIRVCWAARAVSRFHPLTQTCTSNNALLYYGVPVRHSSDTPGGPGSWRSSAVSILGSVNLLVMSSWSTNPLQDRHH